MTRFLKDSIRPVEIDRRSSISQLLEMMEKTGFQGKNLGRAVDIWKDMLTKKTTILFGLAGAMVPAGMRKVIVYLIKNRLIDCLVSTGANLFHDIHETMGNYHWQGSQHADDLILKDEGIDRIYDVFALEREFFLADEYVRDFSTGLDLTVSYTTREFFYLLGKRLSDNFSEEGILTSAYKAGVPVYCPALGDSSIGIALAIKEKIPVTIDIVEDVRETSFIVGKSDITGVIYIGGGTPKNFIQQAEVTANFINMNTSGHEYAIQVTMDSPHWGGLSGCTFEEAKSWGKIAKDARKVMLFCDATIALPIIVTALSQSAQDIIEKRERPDVAFLTEEV